MHGLASLGVWLIFLVKYRMSGIAVNALRISPFHLHNIMKHFEMTLKFSYLDSALESGLSTGSLSLEPIFFGTKFEYL